MGYSPVLSDCESKYDFEIIMFLTKIIELFYSSIILLNVSRICSVVTKKIMFGRTKNARGEYVVLSAVSVIVIPRTFLHLSPSYRVLTIRHISTVNGKIAVWVSPQEISEIILLLDHEVSHLLASAVRAYAISLH